MRVCSRNAWNKKPGWGKHATHSQGVEGSHSRTLPPKLGLSLFALVQKQRGSSTKTAHNRLLFGSHETTPIIWIGKPAPAKQCKLRVERRQIGASTEYIFYCKRAILFLSFSKILTPHPPLHPASVTSRLCCGGRTHSPGGEKDGGSIFWKTRE
jgi:hypothetical protein